MKINNFLYYPSASLCEIILFRIKNFIEVRLKFFKQLLFYRKHVNITKKLKYTKKNKKAFIFANGPSINKLNIKKINKKYYDIFVVNKFINFSRIKDVKYNYYILSDPQYFNPKHPNYKILKKIIENKSISLFVPFNFLSNFKSENNVFGFCDIQDYQDDNATDITKPRGYLSMTAYKALSIALYLGYSEIYICGFDNDQILNLFSDRKNNIFYKNIHFYKKKINDEEAVINVKHLYPSVGYFMYTEHSLFNDLDKFAKVKKSKIINLDQNSLVTSFSKKHNLNVYQ